METGDCGIQLGALRVDDDGRPARTGNTLTTLAYVITAVLGTGVLSLPWSVGQMGWSVGPLLILIFSLTTLYSSIILCECYRTPDPVLGKRNYTYTNVVHAILGKRSARMCSVAQYVGIYGATVAYTIAASTSMGAIAESACRHVMNQHIAVCSSKKEKLVLVFGGVQILFSQLRDMHRMWWLSVVASTMSFIYSSIILGLSASKVSANGRLKGAAFGIPVGYDMPGHVSSHQKVWMIFQALGNIAFSYSFASVFFDIQNTIKAVPSENKTMKRAVSIGFIYITISYMAIGCIGYAALGNSAPGNALTGFVLYHKLFWVVDIANACLIVQTLGGYQMNAQVIFSLIDGCVARISLHNKDSTVEKRLNFVVMGKSFSISHVCLRWISRIVYVISTTLLAIAFPFLNAVLGVLGALTYWPLTVYFPVQMLISRCQIPRGSRNWAGLQTYNFAFLLVSLAAIAGSMEGIVHSLQQHALLI
ncbi:hypothetical protein O6H91_02G153200 [Diphasiastrum complanatum]|uniref:Uncharacterized protein n=1 Tax=Diphasiastrum complanatum TaxID=34168 RepID=A0ACC2ELY7_DIPCM|nr:hypothetical protein O6H91_02G153200 [Diphasiastrum complanatum]